MARDPPPHPAPSASSELRDLSLSPSSIRRTKITIVHPQLRDLILPLARAKVLYPRENTVEQYAWEEQDEVEDDRARSKPAPGTTSTVARLSFTPNCLTVRGNVLACGGQHGQLYISTLPSTLPPSGPVASTGVYGSRFDTTTQMRPFVLSETLPKHAINNSLTILPCWPGEWKRRERSRKAIYSHRDERDYDPSDESEEDVLESVGRVDEDEEDEGEEEEEEEEAEEEEDEEDDEDIEMEDEENEWHEAGEEVDELPSPTSSIGVATYPNTVPFLHAPRLPHLSPSQPTIEIPTRIPRSRRTTSFGSHGTEIQRVARTSMERPGVRYVSSISPRRDRDAQMSSNQSVLSSGSMAGSSTSGKRKRRARRADEPRLLISNNDQTVKMFALRRRSLGPPSTSSHPFTSHRSLGVTPSDMSGTMEPINRLVPRRERIREVLPPSATRFGSSYSWEGIGLNQGIREGEDALRAELERAREHLRNTQETLRREREEFERRLGVSIPGPTRFEPFRSRSFSQSDQVMGLGASGGQTETKELRRLVEIGATNFKYAINHSSISPDMTTMVSVGDSSEVYLFQVMSGGWEFKKIGVYQSSGKGFSTAWSKDGRRFAVASEDGQVTVWDHRSSHPYAVFHTSPIPSPPSFSSDLSSSRQSASTRSPHQPSIVLYDPVTGESSTGASTSGREAARVVKFSPEGSSRDLMVFTEENSNLHIVDARTFHTHVVVPVPHAVPNDSANLRERVSEDGQAGIAGVAFDPTGNWLYSGTEKTIVEWDLRRVGGGEGGTWGTA